MCQPIWALARRLLEGSMVPIFLALHLFRTTALSLAALVSRHSLTRCSFALLAACILVFLPHVAHAFGFDDVAQKAQQLALKPHVPAQQPLPPELQNLTYDQARDIRYKPELALWRKEALPFELMFFHLGKFNTQPVRIHQIDAQGVAAPIPFNTQAFDYGRNKLSPKSWGNLGFAGFRVHYALNAPDYKDELMVFLGASYFRALGAGQHYGLSARGLGLDTVGGQGEEFPRFTEFWIEKPHPGASALVIHALLDSPRATGAYQITVRPGVSTAFDVRSKLYLRPGITTLGIAPLTSMFQHGENQPRPDEFRPEVHDSDGLMIASGNGEWLWRPLRNPAQTQVNSFALPGLKGFGLMQRDRSFASFEDIEAQYERRPSVWVTPQGDWGPGRVELLQLHTPDETNDNIVAYWVPERLPAPGQALELAYQLQWQGEQQQRPPSGWTVQTRVGRGYRSLQPDEVQVVVDFTGPALTTLPHDAPVQAVVTASEGAKILERNVYRNPTTGHWRMTLRIQRPNAKNNPQQALELRAFLQHASHTLTETWTTQL
jgi:periplasmic glucans biosynthesis protein